MYATQELLVMKLGIEVVAAAFIDHLAVCLRLTVDMPILWGGRGRWKLHTDILNGN